MEVAILKLLTVSLGDWKESHVHGSCMPRLLAVCKHAMKWTCSLILQKGQYLGSRWWFS